MKTNPERLIETFEEARIHNYSEILLKKDLEKILEEAYEEGYQDGCRDTENGFGD